MPVRTKQQAAEEATYESMRNWEQLKYQVAALLIARPQSVSLAIRDVATDVAIRLGKSGSSASGLLQPCISALSEFMRTVLSILSQARLVQPDSWSAWIPVAASNSSHSIRGAICLNPLPSRNCQFISIGVTPLQDLSGNSLLFEIVNSVFDASKFGSNDTEAEIYLERFSNPDTHSKAEDRMRSRSDSSKKAIARWPMFFFRVERKAAEQTLHASARRNDEFKKLGDMLRAISFQWLTAHGFRPKQQRATARDPPPAQISIHKREEKLRRPTELSDCVRSPLSNVEPKTILAMDRIVLTVTHQASPTSAGIGSDAQITDHIIWSDPITKERHLIDSRTGTVISMPPNASRLLTPDAQGYVSSAQSVRLEDRKRQLLPATETSRVWLKSLMSDWQNPVFITNHKVIQSVGPTNTEDAPTMHSCCARGHERGHIKDVNTSEEAMSVTVEQLRNATIMSQLAGKFILIKIPSSQPKGSRDGAALVIIDQHAADERIKVELLLQELCSGSTVAFLVPITFHASYHEKILLDRCSQRLTRWGIEHESRSDGDGYDISLKTAPSSVYERCLSEPTALVDLVQAELWDSDQTKREPSIQHAPAVSWVIKLTDCPPGLVEMINSRACRSAIMFNDKLQIGACEELVQKLTYCKLPFQCAHGRPSMVPITNVGAFETMQDDWSARSGSETNLRPRKFLERYCAWRKVTREQVES